MKKKTPHQRLAELGNASLHDWRGFGATRRTDANQHGMAELLPAVLDQMGLRHRCQQEDMTTAWHEIVGTLNATHSRPVSLARGTLTVAVTQPTIHWTLNQMKREILERLNQRFGAGSVRTLRFQVG